MTLRKSLHLNIMILSCTKTKFDIIALSETRIPKQVSLSNILNLNNYSVEFTPTETSGDSFYVLSRSIKKLNKLVNADLKHLVNWSNANKISLNIKKTEMVIFKPKQRKFEGDLKKKLCGKRLYFTESVKCLGVKIDTNLCWQYHLNDISIKLNRANELLFKMRKYVSLRILRFIYLAYHTYPIYHDCKNCTKSDTQLKPNISRTKNDKRVV